MTSTRLAALLQQVLQVLQFHHLHLRLSFTGPSDWSLTYTDLSETDVYLSADDALYLLLERLDLGNGPQHKTGDELSRLLCTEDGTIQYKDIVLDNYLTGVAKAYTVPGFRPIIKGYCSSVLKTLSELFEAGLSVNTTSMCTRLDAQWRSAGIYG